MNTVSSKPDGNAQDPYADLDVLANTHWAYGMPLSFVHDMAHHRLRLHHQAAKSAAPRPPEIDSGNGLTDRASENLSEAPSGP